MSSFRESSSTIELSTIITAMFHRHEEKRPHKRYGHRVHKQIMTLRHRHLPPIDAPSRPVRVDLFKKNVLGKRVRVEHTQSHNTQSHNTPPVIQPPVIQPPVVQLPVQPSDQDVSRPLATQPPSQSVETPVVFGTKIIRSDLTDWERYEMKILVAACRLITKLCLDNKIFERKITKYDSKTEPVISVQEYVFRFMDSANHRIQKMVAILVLIDRLCTNMDIRLNHFNFHRIFASCFHLADKMEDDFYLYSSDVCIMAGLSLDDLVALEAHTFQQLKYNVCVSRSEFEDYYKNLQELVGHYENKVAK